MTQPRHLLTAQTAPVDPQGHLVAIAVNPDGDLLPFVAFQVPVRKDVQYRLVGPPGLQEESLVFRKTAIVEDTELRSGCGEFQRIGLAAIVESRPIEQAGEPGTGIVELQAALNAVEQAVGALRAPVDRSHAAVLHVIKIDTSGTAARGFLGAHGHAGGIVGPVLVHRVLQDIVVTRHVTSLDNLRAAAGGYDHRTRRIDPVAEFRHRAGNTLALLIPLNPPLFVANAPHDDAGMMLVAFDHLAQRFELGIVRTHQARLLEDIHTQAVADVEQGG